MEVFLHIKQKTWMLGIKIGNRKHTTELFLRKAVPHNILCWEILSFAGSIKELKLAGILKL